jgi:hypothetical protein
MNDRHKLEVFLPFPFYSHAMGFTQEELSKINAILRHTFFGLANDRLIENQFQYGSKKRMLSIVKNAEHEGVVCLPSALGAELFLWAFGEGNKALSQIFDENFQPIIDGMPNIVSNAIAIKET